MTTWSVMRGNQRARKCSNFYTKPVIENLIVGRPVRISQQCSVQRKHEWCEANWQRKNYDDLS